MRWLLGLEVFPERRTGHHGTLMRHARIQEDARGEVIGNASLRNIEADLPSALDWARTFLGTIDKLGELIGAESCCAGPD